jgi:hypothetical protein
MKALDRLRHLRTEIQRLLPLWYTLKLLWFMVILQLIGASRFNSIQPKASGPVLLQDGSLQLLLECLGFSLLFLFGVVYSTGLPLPEFMSKLSEGRRAVPND